MHQSTQNQRWVLLSGTNFVFSLRVCKYSKLSNIETNNEKFDLASSQIPLWTISNQFSRCSKIWKYTLAFSVQTISKHLYIRCSPGVHCLALTAVSEVLQGLSLPAPHFPIVETLRCIYLDKPRPKRKDFMARKYKFTMVSAIVEHGNKKCAAM